jgi:hypothetical protein
LYLLTHPVEEVETTLFILPFAFPDFQVSCRATLALCCHGLTCAAPGAGWRQDFYAFSLRVEDSLLPRVLNQYTLRSDGNPSTLPPPSKLAQRVLKKAQRVQATAAKGFGKATAIDSSNSKDGQELQVSRSVGCAVWILLYVSYVSHFMTPL